MRLDTLSIGGFMHFPDVATLDLRDVPPGLVAITGANGEGKTRLLDAGPGALYGSFFSRDGNMADYATARDAFVDAVYSIEGRGVFRSRINVDGQTGNRDAVLEQVQPDGTVVPLNDGKVSTHRDAVAAVFPPAALLLASAFAAQNRAGSFVTLGKKERKDLFGTLLGLDHYARMADTAKTCLDVVDAARARLAERRDLLARDTAAAIADVLQARANALQGEGGSAELRRRELQDSLEALAVERDELTEQATTHLRAVERVQALSDHLAVLVAQREAVDRERTQAASDALAERTRADIHRGETLGRLETRVKTEVDAHAAKVADLDERIAGNRTLASKADAIRAAARDKAAAETQLAELREKEAWHRDARDAAQEEVRRNDTNVVQASGAEKQLKQACKSLETLGTVPCSGGVLFTTKELGEDGIDCGTCAFLKHAAEAHAEIPALEAAARDLPSWQSGVTLWTDQVKAATEAIKAVQIAIAQVEQRIKTLDAQAKYAPELAATEARIAEYARVKAEAETELAARLSDLEGQRIDVNRRHEATFADIDARLQARIAQLTLQLAAVEAERFTADHLHAKAQAEVDTTFPAAARLVAVERELETARQAWTANEATLAGVAVRRSELQREREAFVAKVQQRSDVEDRLRQAQDRMLVWQTFTKAFGRDGLPTLEIAAAGPTVSNLTNDLLSACFGTRFTVELVTQEARADGKGLKECFELKVFDNFAGGDPRDLADLSGGERVIVDEALRAALALYVNSRNVAPIRTCWRDETTGALDPDNATRYVAMLRKLHDLGGFAHIVFITHNEDAAALADTRIVVINGLPMVQPAQRRAA